MIDMLRFARRAVHSFITTLLPTAFVAAILLCGCGPGQPQTDEHDHADHEGSHDHDSGHDHVDHDGAGAHPEDEHDHGAHEDAEGIIHIDAHELSEFGIRMAVAEPGTLDDRTSLAGEIVLNPDRVAHVVARAGGIASTILRTIGDRVDVGETLAVIESPELAESKADYLARAAHAALAATDLARAESIHANTIRLLEVIARNPDVNELRAAISTLDIGSNRGALIAAYAESRSAEAIYDRERTLFERQISSESEYLGAESELKKAAAAFQAAHDDLAFDNRRELEAARRSKLVADVSLQAAERRLHGLGLGEDEVDAIEGESDTELARYQIRAPIAGLIIERHLVRGESVEAEQQVFVVADLDSVWGELTVYQRDLAFVREGQSVRVLGTHDLGSADGTIEYVSPILDEHTRTTIARVPLENAEGFWRPGMFIRAELAAAHHPAAVLVPRSALQELDGATIIFVEAGDGLERRDVEIGRRDETSAEILVGLRPGEHYVAAGGLALKAELNKAALEHAGHAH